MPAHVTLASDVGAVDLHVPPRRIEDARRKSGETELSSRSDASNRRIRYCDAVAPVANPSLETVVAVSADLSTACASFAAHPGSGRTAGAGEFSGTTLSYDAFAPGNVIAQDCVADSVKPIVADAVAVFVGTPSGGKVAHYTGIPFTLSGTYTLNLGNIGTGPSASSVDGPLATARNSSNTREYIWLHGLHVRGGKRRLRLVRARMPLEQRAPASPWLRKW